MAIRIDFHIHTISVENKDISFDFSLAWLKKYVNEANLDAIAITNHNTFDAAQYQEIREVLDCEVYPGIELSLKSGHVNLIFDNNQDNVEELASICKRLSLGESEGISVQQFKELFYKLNTGIIVFETGKSNSVEIDDEFRNPFFRNFAFVKGVGIQLKFSRALAQSQSDNSQVVPVLFSDGHATDYDTDKSRNDISKLMLKNTFIQMEKMDFHQLCLELKNPQHIKINDKGFPGIFQIDVDGQHVDVSDKLNLVVGRRGSGKTYLLDHILDQYNADGSVDYIKQFESAVDTREFLKEETHAIAVKSRGNWVKKHRKSLDSIVQYYKTPFEDKMSDYIDSVKSFANEFITNKTAQHVKMFSEASYEIMDFKSYDKTLQKLKEVIEAKDFWTLVNQDHHDKYLETFQNMYKEITLNLRNKYEEEVLKVCVNNILRDVKIIVKKVTSVHEVNEISFREQFMHFKEKEYIYRSMKKYDADKLDTYESKYSFKIHVVKERWKNADEFLSNVPSTGGRFAVKDSLIIPYMKRDYLKFLENLFSRNYQNRFTLESGNDLSHYLYHFNVELLTSSGTVASGGQEVALGLMMKLDESKKKEVVLVDEPEASLDNVFIKEDLIPKLHEIAQNSVVFVITHNSTLGALLDPDRLIIAKHDSEKKEYKILTGDFSAGRVTDSYGNQFNSYDDFVDAMEAGILTYQEKGEKYANIKI